MFLMNSLFQPNPLPKLPEGSFLLPPEAGADVGVVDTPFLVLTWGSLIITAAIVAVMVHFVRKYRATSRADAPPPETSDHNTALEVTWSVIPFLAAIGLFVWGFAGYVHLRSAPKDSYEIGVQGQKWAWFFKYPNGYVDNKLHVPPNENIRVVMNSVDVLHSLYIPSFRTKMDAVPGRYTSLWFKASAPGVHPIFCAEYCGTSHSDMITELVVHESREAFEQWLENADKPPPGEQPAETGAKLFKKQGCPSCHSVDGSAGVGPSMKGIWGKQETMTDGSTVTVDENYIRESILEPQAKVVRGFPPSMPTYKGQLKDRHIEALIAYIQSLQ